MSEAAGLSDSEESSESSAVNALEEVEQNLQDALESVQDIQQLLADLDEQDKTKIEEGLEAFLVRNINFSKQAQTLLQIKEELEQFKDATDDEEKEKFLEQLRAQPQNLAFVSGFEQMILSNRTWISDSTPAPKKTMSDGDRHIIEEESDEEDESVRV